MRTFPCGLLSSKFLLWNIKHVVLLVIIARSSWGYDEQERQVVRGLCLAQCVSLTYYFEGTGGLINCHSVIPNSADWFVNCRDGGNGRDFVECVGTCSVIRFKQIDYVPAKPEVSVFMDIRSKNISLEWQPDNQVSPGTVYVISMLAPFSSSNDWKQIDIVRGGIYTVGPVDDICILPSFRVASVNRFGSRWFSNATKVPGNIPGAPEDIRLKSITYGEDTNETIFVLQWKAPYGWDIEDIRSEHNVTLTIQCSAPNLEGVMVVMDNTVVKFDDQCDEGYFTMGGRASLNAIGCTIIFKISAVSRCNPQWIGPAGEFRLPIKCSDIMGYNGEYCTNPPVLRPGPVSGLRLTLIPMMEGIMGWVSWQHPIDVGSAGKIAEYHIFYGIVDVKSSQMIKNFEGEPEHVVVPGNKCTVDIFFNITTLDSFKTVGVMVRAAGPGQIIQTPFGNIIYPDNDDVLFRPRAGHLVYEDRKVIVLSSTEDHSEVRETGIGVEIYWRRPDQHTELDVFKYALAWGKLHNDTENFLNDMFETATVSERTTKGNETFMRLGNLDPVSTYGFKILPLVKPVDLQDVPVGVWRNLTLHVFNTPLKIDDGEESTSKTVVTVPVDLNPREESQDKSIWIVVGSVMTTAILLCLIGGLVYRRWHQKRVKAVSPDATPEQRYRHYSLYGPGQSLETAGNPSSPKRVIDEWELPVSSVKTGPLLGSGAFGKVVKGRVSKALLEHRAAVMSLVQGGELCLDQADKYHVTVAIKMLHDHCDSQHKQEFLKEIDLMKRIGHHRHVVSMLGCCSGRDPVYLVVEHMSNGDLLDHLKNIRHRLTVANTTPGDYKNSKSGHQTAMTLLTFARQIALGMEFLASKGYVHRDLAARNVLVDSTQQCKIGDFGLTRYMYNDQIYINRNGGRLPLKWMSVEAIFDQSFSTASDVWSFGIVLFEITTLGGTPYPTIPYRDLLKELQAGYRMERPDNCSQQLYQMMTKCWSHDPSLRPSFKELSDWLQELLSDQSGVDYIEMGVNLDRAMYKVDDKPHSDCTRYPLHRTSPTKSIVPGGRQVVSSGATSDDSGYTPSKKSSSVSSGESTSGSAIPCLRDDGVLQAVEGRHDATGNVLTATRNVHKDDNMVNADDDRMVNCLEVAGTDSQHKTIAVRKRVSFIDVNELIEDDVFDECDRDSKDVDPNHPSSETVCSVDNNNHIHERDGNNKNVSETESLVEYYLDSVSSMKRALSDSNISGACDDVKSKTNEAKLYSSQTEEPTDGLSINPSSNRSNEDVNVCGNLNSLLTEKCRPYSKTKTRKRRPAVTTAPTLALNNDLYFHLDTSRFKQNPPAIKIPRRNRSSTLPSSWDDNDNLQENSYDLQSRGNMTTVSERNRNNSLLYSIQAEVHNSESRDSRAGMAQLVNCLHLGDSQQVNTNCSRNDDTPSTKFSSLHQFDTSGQQSRNSHNNVVIQDHQDEFCDMDFNQTSTPKKEVMRSRNVLKHNSSDPNLGTQTNSNEILTPVFGMHEEKVFHTPTRDNFLDRASRIRNDSGIPRSPDDVSWSPASENLFFPEGSELDMELQTDQKVDTHDFRPSGRGISNVDGNISTTGISPRRHSFTPTQSSQTQPYSSGHDNKSQIESLPKSECPALASEKHPHALHNTKKQNDTST